MRRIVWLRIFDVTYLRNAFTVEMCVFDAADLHHERPVSVNDYLNASNNNARLPAKVYADAAMVCSLLQSVDSPQYQRASQASSIHPLSHGGQDNGRSPQFQSLQRRPIPTSTAGQRAPSAGEAMGQSRQMRNMRQ